MKRLFLFSSLLLSFALLLTSCDGGGNNGGDEENLPTYSIGQIYNVGGVTGVVYELNAEKTSGKIVSLKSGNVQFAADSAAAEQTVGAASKTDGAANTAKFVAGGAETYPVVEWLQSDAIPAGNWYIPSINELKAMLKVCTTEEFVTIFEENDGDIIFSAKDHFSSTEAASPNMYVTNAKNLEDDQQAKDKRELVRAICKF